MRQTPLFDQPITLSELEAHLWEAANILRGSPVDRTDWKSYILPLLFFKRICDVWDEEVEEAVDTYGEDFVDEHRFQIPEGCHWNDVRETPANVGTALQNAMHGIEAANQQHLYGVFGDAQWTNKDRLPDALLKDLIEHFSALRLGNKRIASDVIGDAYEFLIKKFADATNNKAGEFYTPRSVVRLMVSILDPQEGETVYDPTCGAPRGADWIMPEPTHKERRIRKQSVGSTAYLNAVEADPAGWGRRAITSPKPGEHAARGDTPSRPQGCKSKPEYGYERKLCQKRPEGQHSVKRWGWSGSQWVAGVSHGNR